ncbi:MAG: hypothetical protein H6721_30795 [Sandaracinus sp.]|nr:hypothetical protein [Sandaracinus sp.]MCB9618142.1 hypothetical protein [Sandaracinus sp.]MCB9624143.1 hypothetical protein [Sandaracinus sp.]MCB9636520.1 hypothetical protein [Sandaracinus sp.]
MLRDRAPFALWILACALALPARADAPPGGLELALHGTSEASPGRAWRVVGQAFEVRGLARLRALPRAEIEARFVPATTGLSEGRRVQASSGPDGRFVLDVPIPTDAHGPGNAVFVIRHGDQEREIEVPIGLRSADSIVFHTDRAFYEPGEPVHLWALLRDRATGRPLGGRRIELSSGLEGLEPRTVTTDASGVAYTRFDTPDTDTTQHTQAFARTLDVSIPIAANQSLSVGRRTSERLFATIEGLDVEVAPASTIRPVVVVTATSGAPAVGARVRLTVTGLDPQDATTDREGRAVFEAQVPAYLATETGRIGVAAEIEHAAFGSARASGAVTLAVPLALQLELVAESGALVPEVPSALVLRVTDARGEPAVNASLHVRGPGLPRGEVAIRTDRHGLARVEASVPVTSVVALHDGSCGSGRGALFDVRIEGPRDRVARRCVPVVDTALRARLEPAVAAPGERMEVVVTRRPQARGWPVAVLLRDGHGELAGFSVLAPNADRARFEAPTTLGVAEVEARPVDPDAPTTLGVPFRDVALIRPAAPSFPTLRPSADVYPVGGEAVVEVGPTPGGFVALDVRDLAQHGGERAFAAYFLGHVFRHALLDPSTPEANTLIRAALVAHVAQVEDSIAITPRLDAFGRPREPEHDASSFLPALGDLRDPRPDAIALVRWGLGEAYQTLEASIADGSAPVEGEGTRRRFADDALEQVGIELETMGGEPATLAALLDADSSFDFTRAARRVARARLVRVLASLAAALSEGVLEDQPPERWLSILVRSGRLAAEDLRDPWDHVLGLRTRPATVPALAVALGERAFAFPGPDGRLGTADDVFDPFAREVPAGSLYAVACGEDELQRALALLAPGPAALEAMLAAYERVTRAMEAARIGDAATADATQGLADSTLFEMETGTLGVGGFGASGSGSGYGSGSGGLRGRGSRAPSIRTGSAMAGAMGSLRGLVRDDLPATLRFVPVQALAANAPTEVRIPLADAATTYLVEAIHWREDGWIWSRSTRIRVDREVVVDAPVPVTATEGDVLALPVRVRSQGAQRTLRLGVRGEDGIAFDAIDVGEVTVPAGEARSRIAHVPLRRAGRGRVVVAAFEGTTARDAMGRPMEVLPAGRLEGITVDSLTPVGGEVSFEIPEGATWRRAPTLTVSGAGAVLAQTRTGWVAWADRLAGRDPDEEALRRLRGQLPYQAWASALAVGVLWTDGTTEDAALTDAIARLTPTDGAGVTEVEAWTLLGLAPAYRARNRRPAVAVSLGRLIDTLRERVEAEAALSSSRPAFHAAAAAALAWIGEARASREADRRASRHLATFGDETWLQSYSETAHSQNVGATALLALGRLGRRRELDAFPLMRTISRWAFETQTSPPRRASFGAHATELAAAAASLVARPTLPSVRIALDGVEHEVALTEGRGELALGELATGAHVLRLVAGPSEGAVHLRVDGEMRRPWEDTRGPIALHWRLADQDDDQTDARTRLAPPTDARTHLVLEVRNRSPRTLAGVWVEVQLPAGAELDEAALTQLRRSGRSAAVAGGTLRIQVPTLMPTRRVRLPLSLRWSVGGRLVALGTAAWPVDRPDARSVLRPVTVAVGE